MHTMCLVCTYATLHVCVHVRNLNGQQIGNHNFPRSELHTGPSRTQFDCNALRTRVRASLLRAQARHVYLSLCLDDGGPLCSTDDDDGDSGKTTVSCVLVCVVRL